MDEAPFEVEGVTVGESSAIIEGPRKARMNAQKQVRQSLFIIIARPIALPIVCVHVRM